MEKQVFLIEFKYPMEPAGKWVPFTARAKEISADLWEVFHFRSETKSEFPIESMQLKKIARKWIDSGINQESLMTALIGRAIEDLARKPK